MIDLTLRLHRKARIWLNESAPFAFRADGTMKHTFTETERHEQKSLSIAIEVLIPKGARFAYGALGGRFVSGETGELRVSVGITSNNGAQLGNSLASLLDDVRIGLPEEYGKGVVEGVSNVHSELGGLPSGELYFEQAAYGEIGSSKSVFRELGCTITKLVSLKNIDLTEQELTQFLDASLTNV